MTATTISLLSDLYRYRSRERKENLEDWLTECLAAMLRALPAPEAAFVLHRLTGTDAAAIECAWHKISVTTQVVIERAGGAGRQRPDLMVYVDGEPWLLFENKVAHPIDEGLSTAGEMESQLHRYGDWLKVQRLEAPGLKKAIVFVTHHTPVPADFAARLSDIAAYEGLGRHVATWGQLARVALASTAKMDRRFHARVLTEAFYEFLEEHDMASVYPEYRDLAGLAMFVDKVDLWRKLSNDMFGRFSSVAPFAGHVVWAEADGEEGTFGTHRYLRPTDRYDDGTFLATGVWFPDAGDGFYAEEVEELLGLPVSYEPKVYVQLANGEDDALHALKGSPGDGWLRINSDCLVLRDLSSFPPEATDRANAVFAWLDGKAAELKQFLESSS